MRFDRLRLSGFKSFVDPTELAIEDGLTGVVGPNGCGKSNLLEALRWVMGESRPTAMRGGGMEDVIFAGAASRPARRFAEVTLVLGDLAASAGEGGDTVEVVRRITRDAGSAFRLGGRDVRARDVQMLFADASTGAHSPALVRQGQIAELIAARPRQRRRVLEEAAGISGLHGRRHEAELKLGAAEANLARLGDTLDALAAQMAALGRQARQARRYREIGTALRHAEGLLLLGRWQAAERARAAAEVAAGERGAAVAVAARAAEAAARARAAAEAALPPLREEETVAAAVLDRLRAARAGLEAREARAREAIEGLEARLAQIARDAEREAALERDADATVARLAAEADALRGDAEGEDAAVDAARDAAEAAARALAAREGAFTERAEDAVRLRARHAAAVRAAEDARTRLEKVGAERAAAEAQRDAAERARAEAEAAHGCAEEEQRLAAAGAAEAEVAVQRADVAAETAAGAEAEARTTRARAEAAAAALRAETDALAALLDGAEDDAAPLIRRVRAAPGLEAAVGAAMGDDLLLPEGDAPAAWTALAPFATPPPLPDGAEPLAPHVEAPPALARRLALVGLVSDGAAIQDRLAPGQALVSRAGDLWRWDGVRVAAGAAPSAAALRLERANRLDALRRDLAAAEAGAGDARTAHHGAAAALDAARREETGAREAMRAADRAAAEAARALARAEGDRGLAATRAETAWQALARLDADLREARDAARAAAEAEAALPAPDGLDDALGALRSEVEALRARLVADRAAAARLAAEAEARARRRDAVARELRAWRERGAAAAARLGELAARRAADETALEAGRTAPAALADEGTRLSADLARAKARRGDAAEALRTADAAFRDAADAEREAERAASAAREARAAAAARLEAAGDAAAAAAARIHEAGAGTPDALAAQLGEASPAPDAAEAEVARLRAARDALGAVNLRAEEDAEAVAGEHDALAAEHADLVAAIAELRAGIDALNREGRGRLLEAFEVVDRQFGALFRTLFGGGEARLALVESDDPLEAGLEIMCQPPGKRLAALSLLSGGEQTLTALALIFAVFLANPAPICVLDEVDAPLDDANVGRFCDLLDEMTRRTDTRFLVITHHAVTMARMDRLFGVTMVEQGVSQLVSVDLGAAEAMVA
ncbi:chromosome segregation protein SMC [Jannaschia sp. W003]|uniref:chromosome segregation protein SMC n=1 Tax=Jannaschia sp. W003 TaxID=2867012 RepID=UPI0021A96969|nr:chromosome segregation protein SMC [Jannaschia sp. W003]UWQ22996.1 chromosome segregation protein SMC [Jannaschia sp. W003]